ncbi:MAG: CpaF family protein [Bdellovibrionaceae bacterium]|nr:CpaF family protein [Bdellovibrionales bacterium]MCB9086534.1 CpaF family protein [Pseudobdellovibrionaceae bacterium]
MVTDISDLCEIVEEKIGHVPQVNLRSIEDDQGHGGSQHILEILRSHSSSLAEAELNRVIEEFCGDGPIGFLLQRENISEILINGPREIWIEEHGRLKKAEHQFHSPATYKNFVNRIFQEAGVHIDLAQPSVDGFWRGLRLHAIGPPLTSDAPCLSLRKHPSNPWSVDELQRVGWCEADTAHKLRELVQQQKTLVFAGSTGSGKTSILSACLREIPGHCRALILEDTPEISIPNSISLRLLTRQDLRSEYPVYDLSDLIRQSLRMRPDRIILGEVRGPEAKDLVLALSTGHKGGMATLHADSAIEALLRLEILIQLGAPQWQVETIRRLIFHGIDYVILTGRNAEKRQFAGAFRLASLESCGFLLDREF